MLKFIRGLFQKKRSDHRHSYDFKRGVRYESQGRDGKKKFFCAVPCDHLGCNKYILTPRKQFLTCEKKRQAEFIEGFELQRMEWDRRFREKGGS
jgi:hypothetical protein